MVVFFFLKAAAVLLRSALKLAGKRPQAAGRECTVGATDRTHDPIASIVYRIPTYTSSSVLRSVDDAVCHGNVNSHSKTVCHPRLYSI